MSIATIETFMAWVAVLVSLAVLVLLVSVALATVEFFAEHRADRQAARQPFGRYYRHLALGH